jgi:hypothetical protein
MKRLFAILTDPAGGGIVTNALACSIAYLMIGGLVILGQIL